MLGKMKHLFLSFSLRTKLIVSTSCLLLLIVFMGAANQKMIQSLKTSILNMSSSMTAAEWLAQSTAYKPELLQNMWTALSNYSAGRGIPEDQAKDILTAADNLHENFKKYFSEQTANGGELAAKEKEVYSKLESTWAKLHPKVLSLVAVLQEGKQSKEELQKQVSSLTDESLGVSDLLSELSGLVRSEGSRATQEAIDLQKKNSALLILTTILAVIFGAMSLFIVLNVSKWLDIVASRLGEEADQTSSASEQISIASTELSASATEQAAALQETVAAIEQISAMITKNAENAKNSLQESVSSLEAANNGKQTVHNVTSAVEEIDRSNTEMMSQIESSNKQIADIVSLINEIGDKTKVINEIVFQTKLLSFNASVEAARAGEAGKGFAVVAEEVGNLAQMSGSSAKEISDMLEGSKKKVESIVHEMSSNIKRLSAESREKVSAGMVASHECGKVLEEIVRKVQAVSQMMQEIATSSNEQATGVHEINKAMTQLDQVTQKNSHAAEGTAQSGERLTQQAEALQKIVEDLLTVVSGVSNRNNETEINSTNSEENSTVNSKVNSTAA